MYTSPASPCGRPMRRDAHNSIRSRTRKTKLAWGERAGRKNRLVSEGLTIFQNQVVFWGSRPENNGCCLGAAAGKHAPHATTAGKMAAASVRWRREVHATRRVCTQRNCAKSTLEVSLTPRLKDGTNLGKTNLNPLASLISKPKENVHGVRQHCACRRVLTAMPLCLLHTMWRVAAGMPPVLPAPFALLRHLWAEAPAAAAAGAATGLLALGELRARPYGLAPAGARAPSGGFEPAPPLLPDRAVQRAPAPAASADC